MQSDTNACMIYNRVITSTSHKGAVVEWDNEDTQNFMHTVGRVAPMPLSHSVCSKTEVSSYSDEAIIIYYMW